MQVYNLTPLTRTANANRRVVIQGFDLPARGLLVAALAAIPGLIATVIAWTIVGQLGILMLPVVELLAFWLIEGRSRNGLQLRRYQTFYDRQRSMTGAYICCGVTVDPLGGTWATVTASSTPVLRPPDPQPDIFTAQPAKPSSKKKTRQRSKLPHGEL